MNLFKKVAKALPKQGYFSKNYQKPNKIEAYLWRYVEVDNHQDNWKEQNTEPNEYVEKRCYPKGILNFLKEYPVDEWVKYGF